MAIGKTITTYLVEGNAQGIKIVSMSNRPCQCVTVPRSMVSDAKKLEELGTPSLYFLFGENIVYVGQTDNFRQRVVDHNSKKNFWNEALVFVRGDGQLNGADTDYLEYLAIGKVGESSSYSLEENRQTPKEPHLPRHQRDSVIEFFEDVKILAAFLGHPYLLEKSESKTKDFFYCKNKKGADAKGIYEKNFLVLKGSKVTKDVTKHNPKAKVQREEFLESGAIKERDDFYELMRDIEFNSPSAASSFCLGTRSNGWTDWKDKDKNTLETIRPLNNKTE